MLGKGGMGRVYLGEHTGIGRQVAIKILHADLGRNKEAAARFQREAIASGRLDHPNIVGVSDFGVLEDGCLYLVMEALEGEPLGKRLERIRRIPWPAALHIVRGVLAGLRHAHERGVVHRDIKPDNVFLAHKDGEEVVKILDFGIAKLYAGTADDPATTRAGLTVGTPAYLSPEQAVGGAIVPASDLYSTSVVLYEMLVGRPPFEDKDPLAIMTAHVSRDPPPFAEVAPDLALPPGLEEIVQRGLAKVSAERQGSAAEYQQQLDQILRAAGHDVPTPMSARASQSMGIPIGPYAIPTPPPGTLTGTPAPGFLTPSPGFLATPMPFPTMTTASSESQRAPTAPVRSTRKSLADISEPIPRRWLIAAAIFVALAIVGALVLLSRGNKSSHEPPKPGTAIPVAVPMPPPPPPIDKETRLKAAIHDLEDGATCADRKEAIPKLVELGDKGAIPALKKARYRGKGGVLGIGESNANSCLRTDAEAAIKALGGTLR